MNDGPLAGIRVIELTMWVQGPIAGTLLGDLGADVIKVEKAGVGDHARHLASLYGVDLRRGEANLLWALCNRNKRSLALDLYHEEAGPVLRELIAGADVFLSNLQAPALQALGASREQVMSLNPRIVYAHTTGFGERGPMAAEACQDTVGMAYGGFLHTVSADSARPYYPPGAMSDLLAGTMLAFGVLAALRERDRSGEGQLITTSRLQSLLWLQSLNIGAAANNGSPFAVSDRATAPNPTFNLYPCGDGRWIAIGMPVTAMWEPLCRAIGREDLLADARFATSGGRAAQARDLIALLDAHFATAPAAEWVSRGRAAGLWVTAVNRVEDLVDDAQVAANGYLRTDSAGWVAPRTPFTLAGHEPPARPAPGHGEHTDAVLAEAGLDPEAVQALRTAGIAW